MYPANFRTDFIAAINADAADSTVSKIVNLLIAVSLHVYVIYIIYKHAGRRCAYLRNNIYGCA